MTPGDDTDESTMRNLSDARENLDHGLSLQSERQNFVPQISIYMDSLATVIRVPLLCHTHHGGRTSPQLPQEATIDQSMTLRRAQLRSSNY